MLVAVDVETPVWQGSGSDGMLGCSAGDSGRWRGVGLTGGNPGVVGFSSCCGSLGTESLTSGLFPSAWPSSEVRASMLGVGASGSVSFPCLGSAVTAGGLSKLADPLLWRDLLRPGDHWAMTRRAQGCSAVRYSCRRPARSDPRWRGKNGPIRVAACDAFPGCLFSSI